MSREYVEVLEKRLATALSEKGDLGRERTKDESEGKNRAMDDYWLPDDDHRTEECRSDWGHKQVAQIFNPKLLPRLKNGGGRAIVPLSQSVKLPYADAIELIGSGTSLVTTTWVFRLNSCFDPDLTYTGHQPLGFDEYSAFYHHYLVTGVKYTVKMQCYNTSGNLMGLVAPTAASTAVSNARTLMELPQSKWTILPMHSGGPVAVMSGRVDIGKWFGLDKKAVRANPDLGAAVTSNPTEQVYLQVAIAPFGTRTASNYVQIQVHLEMEVLFREPVSLGES